MKNLAMKPFEEDLTLPNGSNLVWGRWGWILTPCVLSVGPLYQHSGCERPARSGGRTWRSDIAPGDRGVEGQAEDSQAVKADNSSSDWGPCSACTGALGVTYWTNSPKRGYHAPELATSGLCFLNYQMVPRSELDTCP